jgi:hypothetical protein
MLGNLACMQSLDNDTVHLDFGTVMHAGAAEHWRRITAGPSLAPMADVMRVLRQSWQDHPSLHDHDKLTLELAESMMRYYCDQAVLGGGHWAARLPGWKLKLCEERFSVEVRGRHGPCLLSLQVDRLASHEDSGANVIVDLKSAGRFGSYWERGWTLNLQQQLYKRAVQIKYEIEADVWIEGLLKKMPTDVKYHACPDWDADELAEAEAQFCDLMAEQEAIVNLCRDSDGAVDLDRFYEYVMCQARFNRGDCFSYGRTCPYYDLCKARPSERLGLLLARYEYVEPTWIG